MTRRPLSQALGEALSHALNRASQERDSVPKVSRVQVFPFRTFQDTSRGALFCIPGAGASMTSYRELANCLELPIYGIQPRGLDGLSVPHSTVRAAAAAYFREIQAEKPAGSVHLLGHSYGGWIAFQVAQLMCARGMKPASLNLLDTDAPDENPEHIRQYSTSEAFRALVEVLELAAERSLGIDLEATDALSEAASLAVLHASLVKIGQLPQRSAPDLLRGPFWTFATCLRTSYRPTEVYPYPVRLILLSDPRRDGETDRRAQAKTIEAWKRWAPQLIASLGAGNHMTGLKRPHVSFLASYLSYNVN